MDSSDSKDSASNKGKGSPRQEEANPAAASTPPESVASGTRNFKRKRESFPRSGSCTGSPSSHSGSGEKPMKRRRSFSAGKVEESATTSSKEAAMSESSTTETKGEKQEVSKGAVIESSTTTSFMTKGRNQGRWRAHQMVEDYVELASNMVLVPTTHIGPYGYNDNYHHQGQGENGSTQHHFPLELISSLGFLKSPLRRPTIIETWSPFEISMFEAGMGHYGKDFFQIHKLIQTKSTKEVIDFYYVWKKTSHYKVWKQQYVAPGELALEEEYGVMTPVKKTAR